MGKPVITGLLGLATIFLATAGGTAQEAPAPVEVASSPTGFKPGKFLTSEDFEHIRAALEYVNLAPEDLGYEKKHREDRHRLALCDQALDLPLTVPAIAEQAAKDFSRRSTPTQRCMAAAQLLDIGANRWTIDEIREDEARYRKLLEVAVKLQSQLSEARNTFAEDDAHARRLRDRIERLESELDEAQEAMRKHGREMLFGEEPVELVLSDARDLLPRNLWNDNFAVAAESLARAGRRMNEVERRDLAARVGGHVAHFDLPLPGARALTDGEAEDLYDLGARTHLDGILMCATRIRHVLENLANHWRAAELVPEAHVGRLDHGIEGVTGGVVAAWQSKWGKFVIGGTGPNTYEGDDFIGIIDLGGDDVYRGRIACGIGLEGFAPISFVLDLGGNDRYEGGDGRGDSGDFTQGFGFLGVGILMDLGGGDDYYSARFCAQGAGLCGYGELYDDGGNDTFKGDSFVQGAGMFGYGQLTNLKGNDVYRAARYSQGFAQVMGVGVLTDGDGNDLYYAGGKYLHQPLFNDRYQSLSQGFAIGNRNSGTGGGVALLLDEGKGNDVFQADIYGQGSSYWYSLGMLVSEGGNNTYTLGQYGQGAGIHLSAGILVDLEGDDTYTNTHGVGTGGAHDWSVGWLIDRAGNDLYQGNGQGQGLNYGIGILLDCAGDDSHSSRSDGNIGKGVNNDISLLLDLAGKDSYTPKDVKDGQFTRRGRHALVYDVPEGWFPNIDTSTLPTVQDPPPGRVKVQHILISWKGKYDRIELKDSERTKAEAEILRDEVLKKARTKGADWKKLQADHNEDSLPHKTYDIPNPEGAQYLPSFVDKAKSLGVGQIDWYESIFGFHIIKRIE